MRKNGSVKKGVVLVVLALEACVGNISPIFGICGFHIACIDLAALKINQR
jgi:hypothetical protein